MSGRRCEKSLTSSLNYPKLKLYFVLNLYASCGTQKVMSEDILALVFQTMTVNGDYSCQAPK